LKKERFASIKGCFAILEDHPGASRHPSFKRRGFVSSHRFVIHSQVLIAGATIYRPYGLVNLIPLQPSELTAF
jgi:hypothetical protein